MDFSEDERKDLRREQIVLLVRKYYEKFDFLKYESLEVLIDKALGLFLDSDLSIEEISDKLLEAVMDRKKDLDARYDSEKIEANHEELYGRLEQLFSRLNQEGVDCQLAGALCGYLKFGEESDRCHDDIDICLNEDDMDKFRKICLDLGLLFEDNRLNSPRVLKNGIPSGEHEVIARSSDSDFHVGVFCFERMEDDSVVNKGYYHNEDGESCVREEILSSELAQEVFGGEEIDFRGTPITITPPEYVYLLKSYTRSEKDFHDIEFLDGKIDTDKVERIRKLSSEGRVVQNVQVSEVPSSKINNPYSRDLDDDLGLMLADDEGAKDKENNHDYDQEKGKVFVKRDVSSSFGNDGDNNAGDNSSDQGGYASGVALSTMGIIALVSAFIALMLMYMVR